MNERDINFILRFRNLAGPGLRSVRDGLQQVGRAAGAFQRQAVTLGASLDRIGKAGQAVGAKLKSAGAAIREAGSAITIGIGAPLTAAVGASIRAMITFEDALTGVAKTVDAPAAVIEELGRQFRELSEQIPISADELARVGQAAGQLGVATENIVDFTEVVAKLGVTTDLSAEQAAVALARFSTASGEPQENIDRLGAAVVDLGNNFAVFEGELIDVAQRIAPAGRVIGLTADQTLGFGAAVRSAGINVEAGGTAISRTFTEIASAASKGGSELVTFANTAGLTTTAFRELVKNNPAEATLRFVEGLDRLQKSGANVFQVFDDVNLSGIRVQNTLLALSGDTDQVRRALELSNKAFQENTALNQEAEKFFATLSNQLRVVGNSIRNSAAALAEAFRPEIEQVLNLVRDGAAAIRRFADFVGSLDEGARRTALAFIAFGVALGPALLALGTFVQIAGFATTGLFTLVRGFGLVSRALGGLRFAALFTGPLGIAVVAITAGIAALIKFKDEVIEFRGQTATLGDVVVATFEVVGDIIAGAGEAIKTVFGPAIDFAIAQFEKFPDDILPSLQTVANAFKAVGNAVIQSFQIVIVSVTALVTDAIATIGGLFNNVTDRFKQVGASARLIAQGEFTAAISEFNKPVRKIFDEGPTAVEEGLEEIKEILAGDPLGDAFEVVFNRAATRASRRAADVVEEEDPLGTGIEAATESTVAATTRVAEIAAATFGEKFAEGFRKAIGEFQKTALDTAANTQAAFGNAFQQSEDALLDFIETGKFEFAGFAQSILREFNKIAIREVLGRATQGLFGDLRGGEEGGAETPGAIGGLFGGLFGGGGQPSAGDMAVVAAVEQNTTATAEGDTQQQTLLGSLGSSLSSGFSSLGSSLSSAFSAIGGLFGGGGAGGGSGAGSALGGVGSILGVVGGLFSQGGVSTNPPATGVIPIGAFGRARGFQRGGISGSDTIPALLSPNEAVVPLSGNRGIPVEGMGGGPTNVTFNIQTNDADSFKRSQQQIMAQAGSAVERARNRGT